MKIGVLKERKRDEKRVALRPDQVEILVRDGHNVWVELGAGCGIGLTDEDYAEKGAKIVDQDNVYSNACLLLKVKCPLEEEFQYLTERHILFTYLHFDENIPPQKIMSIVNTGVTGIAYEWVEKNGCFPLLQPMSELTGAIFARKSMSILFDQKGLLGGSYLDEWPAATVMVIGVGHIGANAINVFLRNKFNIIVVDKNSETLEARLKRYVDVEQWKDSHAKVIVFDEVNPDVSVAEIRNCLPQTDIVICAAVRRATLSKEKCRYLIRREDMSLMSPDSVLCDATACERDFIETAVSSESVEKTYREEGVIHYNCDHIPALVPRTATNLLTRATFPYVQELCGGFETAVHKNHALYKAVMCYKGKLTHDYSAQKKGLKYASLGSIM